MIPESNQDNSIRLYKADDFPVTWSFKRLLLVGQKFKDSSVIYFDHRWWLFTTPTEKFDTLCLYYADDLFGPWIEHPKSPIIKGNANIARPGGRLLVYNGHLFRFTQDDEPVYGNQVYAFEITKLSIQDYEERKVTHSPILKASGKGWNKFGMHQIDLQEIDKNKWICCVDGWSGLSWVVKYIQPEDIIKIIFAIVLFLILLIFYKKIFGKGRRFKYE